MKPYFKKTKFNFLKWRVQIVLFLGLGMMCFSPLVSFGQKPLKIEKEAFGHGEHLQYTVSYHWGIIWIDAGTVDFMAHKGPTDSKTFWHFKSTGASLRRFDWLFRVRDTFEVFTTANPFKPSQFRRNTFEGSKHTYNLYQFDYAHQKAYLTTQENKKQHLDTLQLETPITDVLTATYLTRSLDFSKLSMTDTLFIPMLMDRKVTQLPIIFLGNEELTTPSGKSFSCLKFSASPEEGTIFSAHESIMVWVTDDDNRMPVLIEAKIAVGSIQVHLTGYEKLAHPLKAYLRKE